MSAEVQSLAARSTVVTGELYVYKVLRVVGSNLLQQPFPLQIINVAADKLLSYPC